MQEPQRDPSFEGLVADIQDGYAASARGEVAYPKDVFAEYGLDWDDAPANEPPAGVPASP
jgi:hypothetical protein